MNAEELYNLELNVPTNCPSGLYIITRVPNGWLYRDCRKGATSGYPSSTFVELHDEFKPKGKAKKKEVLASEGKGA